MSAGITARCESLVKDQLYAVLLYNSSPTDVDALVTVVWSNQFPPSKVTVRGSIAQSAPPNFVFVSGTDTNFVSVSLSPGSAAIVTAFIVSISMPSNTDSTGTKGVNSAELPNDGQFHSFDKYDRYYTESADGWRGVTVENLSNQFIYLQILKNAATVTVVNVGSGLANGQVSKFGPTASADGTVVIKNVAYQTYEVYVPGDGETWVWMNADSQQNSVSARIALQQLSVADVLLNVPDTV